MKKSNITKNHKINVKEEMDASVKVRIDTKTYAGKIIEQLTDLSEKSFRKTLSFSRQYRRINRKLEKASGEEIKLNIKSKADIAQIIDALVALTPRSYRSVVRNAKRMRKSLEALQRDLLEQERIDKEDRENRQATRSLNYETI